MFTVNQLSRLTVNVIQLILPGKSCVGFDETFEVLKWFISVRCERKDVVDFLSNGTDCGSTGLVLWVRKGGQRRKIVTETLTCRRHPTWLKTISTDTVHTRQTRQITSEQVPRHEANLVHLLPSRS